MTAETILWLDILVLVWRVGMASYDVKLMRKRIDGEIIKIDVPGCDFAPAFLF